MNEYIPAIQKANIVANTMSELLINDISKLINQAKEHVAREYNSTQGKRLVKEV